MPMNLPTLADLQATYGYGDPSVYTQAAANQSLAQQYAQQELQGQQQDVRTKELKNIFDVQQNPQLIEQRRLQNVGLGDANVLSGVTSRRAVANEPMQLSEDQKKFALTATQQDLDAAIQHAQGQMRSGDPRQMQEAQKILDFTDAARAARAKAEAKMSQAQMQRTSAEKIAAGHDAASRYGTDVRSRVASSRQKADQTVAQRIANAKTPAHKANVYEGAAQEAMLAGDDQLAQYYTQLSQQAIQENLAARQAAAQVASGNQLDLQALQEQGKLVRQNQIPGPGVTRPAAAVRAPTHSLADVAKMYPGVPMDKVKQAYKQKFGVDLQ